MHSIIAYKGFKYQYFYLIVTVRRRNMNNTEKKEISLIMWIALGCMVSTLILSIVLIIK